MKILVVADQFPTVSETFILNHITSLLDEGHRVNITARKTLIDENVHPNFHRYQLMEKTFYYEIPENYLNRLIKASQLIMNRRQKPFKISEFNPFYNGLGVLSLQHIFRRAALPEERFDLIHVHYSTLAISCLPLKVFYQAPIVISFHGCFLQRFKKISPIIFYHLFKNVDGFISNSSFTEKWMVQNGCPPNKIRRIPVIALEDEVEDSRKILNQEELKLLSVARLIEAKGIQFCLNAVKKLLNSGYKLKYVVVGDGPYRNYLEILSDKLGLKGIVEFTGYLNQDEVQNRYKESDIFVIPSTQAKNGWIETQGLVVQEAQRHGLVVVGSDIGGIPDGLNWGKAGMLFKPENSDDLVVKLKFLIDHKDTARDIARKGMEYYSKHFNKNLLVHKTISFYESILKGAA